MVWISVVDLIFVVNLISVVDSVVDSMVDSMDVVESVVDLIAVVDEVVDLLSVVNPLSMKVVEVCSMLNELLQHRVDALVLSYDALLVEQP